MPPSLIATLIANPARPSIDRGMVEKAEAALGTIAGRKVLADGVAVELAISARAFLYASVMLLVRRLARSK